MTKLKIRKILKLMDDHYPQNTKCYLNYETDWQLLIATILSAQCTDDRVNLVTAELFKKYTSVSDFAGADLKELENDVKSTGFYRNKAKSIICCARMLLDKYGGVMPPEIEELTSLPGVGRKTANVIRSHIFNIPSIVVDTHVKRLSNRIGIVNEANPDKIEMLLYSILPKKNWIRYNTQMIAHGRKICKAVKPRCDSCFLAENKLCMHSQT